MVLYKTEKARAEFRPGVRSLGLRERALLLQVDGRRTAAELRGLFDGSAAALLEQLLNDGFLSTGGATFAPGAEASTAEPEASLQPASPEAFDATPAKPSLASARMFLFDMGERLFSRREPELAERFRMALRDARDRESMVSVSAEMIVIVEAMGAPERAQSIQQQIDLLLSR